MASTSDQLFEAIEAGDVGRVDSMLDDDPAAASSRDATGVSALMRALYRFDKGLVEAVKRRVDILDVFEAAAFGDVDRLTEILSGEASLVNCLLGRRVHGLALRRLLRQAGRRGAAHRAWRRGRRLRPRMDDGDRDALRGSRRHADVVRVLLDAGANPNVRQSAGWTPLHAAAMNGDLTSVELLLDSGADPAATNEEGRSVVDLANESGDDATADRIRSAVQAAP